MLLKEFLINLIQTLIIIGVLFCIGFLFFKSISSQYSCIKTYHPKTDVLQSIYCKHIIVKKQ